MKGHFLLSTLGSLGDLYPVLNVAHALESLNHPVVLALGAEDAAIAQAQGLDARAIGLSQNESCAQLGLSQSEVARMVFKDPSPLLRRALYPQTPAAVRAMLPLAQGARLVSGTLFAFAAPLTAEVAGLPYVPLWLQPMLMRSALMPPRARAFSPPMLAKPRGALGLAWNRALYGVVDAELRRRHSGQQNLARKALGLPPTRALPIFGHAVAPAACLGLWDPALVEPPIDAPTNLALCGFAQSDRNPVLPAKLAQFLKDGPAPLVVTLGSVAHALAGDRFWHRAVALARKLGMRAVLLSGEVANLPAGPDIIALPYAAHRPLFEHAAAVLHHGGMGTTAEALRAGVPHLVCPLGADQTDNAAHLIRRGVGVQIGKRVDAPKYLRAAKRLLSPETQDRAQTLKAALIEDGALRAARKLVDIADAAGR